MGHTQLCSRNTPVFLLKVIPGGARFNYWDMERNASLECWQTFYRNTSRK